MPTQPINLPDGTTDPATYKQVVLALAADADPLDTMSATVERWRELTKPLDRDQLYAKPQEQEWSVAEITAHLFDVDLVFGFRGRLMLTADNPTYPGYDEKLWTPLPRPPFPELLDAWAALRNANLLIWREVPKADYGRTATHSEQGPETFEELIRKVAGHDIAHLNQMQRAAEAAQSAAR